MDRDLRQAGRFGNDPEAVTQHLIHQLRSGLLDVSDIAALSFLNDAAATRISEVEGIPIMTSEEFLAKADTQLSVTSAELLLPRLILRLHELDAECANEELAPLGELPSVWIHWGSIFSNDPNPAHVIAHRRALERICSGLRQQLFDNRDMFSVMVSGMRLMEDIGVTIRNPERQGILSALMRLDGRYDILAIPLWLSVINYQKWWRIRDASLIGMGNLADRWEHFPRWQRTWLANILEPIVINKTLPYKRIKVGTRVDPEYGEIPIAKETGERDNQVRRMAESIAQRINDLRSAEMI